MFENIIGQEKTISALQHDVDSQTLPGSLLIHGEPYSGKLTTALEIARVLSCGGDRSWSCRCRACDLHRVLSHPGMLLLGSRAFGAELAAAADVLRRLQNVPSRYLYVRAARKLLRRCDPRVWEGTEPRMRQALAAAAEIEESLADLEPGASLPPPEELQALLERIGEKARQVASALPRDNTPISVIRKAAFWARLSTTEPARVLIFENADRMVEASRNSLLKLLEEPPGGLHIILLSTNVQAMLPTILSRVRRYRLEPRNEATAREVLSRVFRVESGGFPSLAAYFLSWDKVTGDETGLLAELFLGTAGSAELDERALYAMYDKCQRQSELDGGAFFREFSRSLAERMRARWLDGTDNRDRVDRWNRILQDAASEQARLNLQPMLVVQATLYRMRDAAA